MKKFLIIFLIFLVGLSVNAKAPDYLKLYDDTPLVDFTFLHDLDPFQDEDYIKYAWSPYPLMRTSSALFFKTLEVPADYYLLTPRTYKGRDIVLFKQSGRVAFIIPAVKKELVPEGFYASHIPVPQKTSWQKFCTNFANFWYKVFKSSKKEPPPQSYILTQQIDGRMFLIEVYYGNYKYSLLFKNTRY